MKYIFFPADCSEPIEELEHNGVCELTDDSFIQHIKEYFAKKYSNADIDKGLLKEHLAQHAGSEAANKVNDDMMEKLLQMSAIDIFPVLLPMPQTQQKGVSVYVDDKGISKRLPRNDRVSVFVQELGYPGQVFHGDAFMARVHDSEVEDIWKRVDFTMEDVNSNAEWVAQAREQTKNKKSAQEVADFKKQFTSNPVQVQNQNPRQLEDKTGSTTHYNFRDAGDELELTFLVEAKDKKKVKVVFKPSTLHVSYDGQELFSEQSKLFGPVDPEDCSWSIVDGQKLVVTLMKKGTEQWPQILE